MPQHTALQINTGNLLFLCCDFFIALPLTFIQIYYYLSIVYLYPHTHTLTFTNSEHNTLISFLLITLQQYSLIISINLLLQISALVHKLPLWIEIVTAFAPLCLLHSQLTLLSLATQ